MEEGEALVEGVGLVGLVLGFEGVLGLFVLWEVALVEGAGWEGPGLWHCWSLGEGCGWVDQLFCLVLFFLLLFIWFLSIFCCFFGFFFVLCRFFGFRFCVLLVCGVFAGGNPS